MTPSLVSLSLSGSVMKRHELDYHSANSLFQATSRPHPKNGMPGASFVMRGGIRF